MAEDYLSLGYDNNLSYGSTASALPLSSLAATTVGGSSSSVGTASSAAASNPFVDRVAAESIDSGSLISNVTLVPGGVIQTDQATDTGIKMDSDSLRGYDDDGVLSFELDPQTGAVIGRRAVFPGIPLVSMMVSNADSIADAGTPRNLVMTRNGRYLINGFTSASTMNVFDTYEEFDYNYRGFYDYRRTGLAITPEVCTRVVSSEVDYVLAVAGGGTTFYRYDADGQNETAVTVSGFVLTAARRMGYDPSTGYVYIQDGANLAATTVRRFTFSGTTLTYVDTVTLNAAPAASGSTFMWVGDTNLCFVDAYTGAANQRTTWQRYNKNTGVQASSLDFGSLNTNHALLGFSERPHDNACIEWHQSGSNALAQGYNISSRLDS